MTDERVADPADLPDAVAVPRAEAGAAKYNTKAVIGLILSVISIFFVLVPVLNWIIAVPGIILGVLGRGEVLSSGERSRDLATAAIVTGALSAGLSLVLLIAIGATAVGAAQQVGPGGDSDACTSTTGDFTQQQLQDCFDSQHG
jgi:hypothetical protein